MVTFDIQGFELEAVEVIGVAIELEMTLVPMCRGEASAGRVLVTLETMGFKLFSINEFGKGKNGSVSYFNVLAIREHLSCSYRVSCMYFLEIISIRFQVCMVMIDEKQRFLNVHHLS